MCVSFCCSGVFDFAPVFNNLMDISNKRVCFFLLQRRRVHRVFATDPARRLDRLYTQLPNWSCLTTQQLISFMYLCQVFWKYC